MNDIYIVLIGICVVIIGIVMMNIAVIIKTPYRLLKIVCTLLFAISILRYFTLIVYGDNPTVEQLEVLRYFYFATSIGITIPTASAVWYITPYYKEKIKYPIYLMCWLPWIAFYTYLIYIQPTVIKVAPTFGYELVLTGKFPIYLSIVQGSFITIIIFLALFGLFKYKNEVLRSQYFVLIIAQLMLLLDGLSYFFPVLETFPPFTVSEGIAFMAIYYAFSKKPLDEKRG